MPVRHSGNQREEVGDWDEWVEREIADAHERGDFDDLPAGKPFDLSTNALDPSLEFAYSRLKNAGMKPAWMDLDGECHDLRTDLDDFLERSSAYLQAQIDLLLGPDAAPPAAHPSEPAPPARSLIGRVVAFLRMPDTGADRVIEDGPRDRLDLIQLRQQMKEQYLERAAVLDKRIVSFNNTLSRQMMHLERVRMVPDRASRQFEERCPQIPLPPESPDA